VPTQTKNGLQPKLQPVVLNGIICYSFDESEEESLKLLFPFVEFFIIINNSTPSDLDEFFHIIFPIMVTG
jgi:hypothetical protein